MPPVYSTTYGKRTGVTTLKKLVKLVCDLYDTFRPHIIAWVDNQMSPEDATAVKAWLDALTTVCLVITQTPDD